MTIREIICRTNVTCRRLGREEDGVVLGVMVVTLMALFLMGATTFAVGEHIRDRIEIQNAVDSAAYSAAVVQADTLSRIAAINQAMAWTYVQMGRRHMDAILDRWMERIVTRFDADEKLLEARYRSLEDFAFLNCSVWLRRDWGIGYPEQDLGNGGNKQIRFNKRLVVTIDAVRQDWNQARSAVGTYHQLERHIRDVDEPTLRDMAAALDELIANLQVRMEAAAEEVLRINGVKVEGDWITVLTGEATTYFHVYGEQNDGRDEIKGEPDFLLTIPDFPNFENNGDGAMGAGAEDEQWFARQDSQPWREYVQRDTMLTAEWYGFAAGWSVARRCRWCGRHGVRWMNERLDGLEGFSYRHNPGDYSPGYRYWKGEDVDGIPRQIAEIEPRRLSVLFFDGNGAGPDRTGTVIVAVARRMRHPFQAFIDAGGQGGFYDAFGDQEPRLMVAAAAARAGYRDSDREGEYNPFSEDSPGGWHHSDENLGQTDWDAVLIPLRRAWVVLGSGGWQDDSGRAVLDYLWNSAEWREIVGGSTSSGLPAGYKRPGEGRDGRVEAIPRQFGTTSEELARSLYH